jgi:hypothetical protein
MARAYLTFLREALAPLIGRRVIRPALALIVLLTASNIVILQNVPAPGAATLPPLFIAAAIARIGGLLVLMIAMIRILAGSPRSPWMPDGAFWLSCLATVAMFGLSAAIGQAVGDRTDPLGAAISGVLFTLVIAPISPWLVALAAERPLAWSPRPWLRRFGTWLGPLIVWAILLLTPLAYVHIVIDTAAVEGRLAYFWPAMLFDGPLSAVMALIGLGLNNAAYRRVARG